MPGYLGLVRVAKKLLLTAAGAAVIGAVWALMQRRNRETPLERRAQPDPEALAASSPPDRAGLDMGKLQELEMTPYKPLVQYLTAIQVQRGENETLLFVRQRDLDALAALAGEEKEEFMENFRRLGVLLSMN